MVFSSHLPKPALPSGDVFSYLLQQGRRDYPRERVLYRVDDSEETLTLAELEEKSRRFASVVTVDFDIRPGDAIALFAADTVSRTFDSPIKNHLAMNIVTRFQLRTIAHTDTISCSSQSPTLEPSPPAPSSPSSPFRTKSPTLMSQSGSSKLASNWS